MSKAGTSKKRAPVRARSHAPSPRIFTIGHSNRPIDEFIEILQSQKLKLLVDIRTIPKSRHNPQFTTPTFERSLSEHNIEYVHLKELGGLRHPRKDSINTAWRNSSFRGYADYMQTPKFEKALKRLISLSKRKKLAIMCAEAVPWRCHRSLVADALLARGIPVVDLMSKTSSRPHKMTSFAKVRKGQVTYPGPADEM